MMGAGKSSIGRRLATRLGMPFVDADTEIEKAAGMTIPDIFATHGEPYFRAGEARVIARLLESGPQVLATGGGAFMNAETRAAIRAKGISVWLKADFDVLMRRIKRRNDRPLLKTADPAETLRRLIDERYPVYAEADLTVQSRDVPHDTIVDEIVDGLRGRLASSRRAGRRRAMTAPLRAGDPIIVDVALGDRTYDIVIGRGLLASLGARIAKLRPGARPRSSPTRPSRGIISRRREASLDARRASASSSVMVPAGESTKSFRHLEQVCDALIAARIERGDLVVALGGGVVGDLARLCRGGRAARRRLRAGADHAAGAGRFLGRRQDRDQLPPRQEPDRRVPPADPGGRRHRAARHAAGARVPRRLCRGREIRPARRRRILRLARGQLAGRVRRRAGARARRSR